LKERLLRIAKWAWLCLVLAAAVWYLARNGRTVAEEVRRLEPQQIGLAIALLLATKLILTEITRRSLRPSTPRPAYRSCFYINGVTQVAKYLPGGIWHFVGKFAYYRGMALTSAAAGQAMIAENAWLVASSIFFGLILSAPALARNPDALPVSLRWLVADSHTPILLGLSLWLIVLALIEVVLGRNVPRAVWRTLSLIVVQSACWFAAGLSFWILFPSAARPQAFPLAVGAFSLAWAAGYLTIFAPGGIGAREAVLVALLSGITTPEHAIVLASIHRLLWTSAELLMGATAVVGGALGIDWRVQPLREEESPSRESLPG
jgi:uncharacterized membrane protein YbhN (UPF0104 family)